LDSKRPKQCYEDSISKLRLKFYQKKINTFMGPIRPQSIVIIALLSISPVLLNLVEFLALYSKQNYTQINFMRSTQSHSKLQPGERKEWWEEEEAEEVQHHRIRLGKIEWRRTVSLREMNCWYARTSKQKSNNCWQQERPSRRVTRFDFSLKLLGLNLSHQKFFYTWHPFMQSMI
jgi:hypothetical protein